MTAIVLSASLTVDGKAISLAKSYTADVVREYHFDLAAGAVRQFSFDDTYDGTALKFLYIKALKSSDLTQEGDVSYGTSDAEASDAANGVAWTEVAGLCVDWSERALSTLNRFDVYNAGSDRLTLDVVFALEP